MNKVMMVALAFATLVCAENWTQKIVPVKNADANKVFVTVNELMKSQLSMRQYENNIVLNGTSENVAAAEQLIKNLEAASPRERDIELTGYIVVASAQAGEGGNVPGDLEPVLKQFRNLLTYKSFRVIDTIILRAKENSEAHSQGFLPLPNVQSPGATAAFAFRRANIVDDTVHLTNLHLSVQVPFATGGREVNILTDADIKPGQKVAIGKASVDAAGDALILVVSANVVN